MEHWWNDTDRRNPNHSEKHLSHFHFVVHRSPQSGKVSNPYLRSDRPATNRVNHGTAQETKFNLNYIQRFSAHRAVNTLLLVYENCIGK
jgi:hypothetical protein